MCVCVGGGGIITNIQKVTVFWSTVSKITHDLHLVAYLIRDSALQSELYRGDSTTLLIPTMKNRLSKSKRTLLDRTMNLLFLLHGHLVTT